MVEPVAVRSAVDLGHKGMFGWRCNGYY